MYIKEELELKTKEELKIICDELNIAYRNDGIETLINKILNHNNVEIQQPVDNENNIIEEQQIEIQVPIENQSIQQPVDNENTKYIFINNVARNFLNAKFKNIVAFTKAEFINNFKISTFPNKEGIFNDLLIKLKFIQKI